MLHLAVICMVCAVLAPIEGTALTGVNNNNKSNIFCHVDEREQRQRGKSFPGLYNLDAKNCFDCAKRQVTDRTHCFFLNNFTNQCQFSQTLCSFRNKLPNRKKRYPDSQLEYTVQRRNVYSLLKNKGKMLFKRIKCPNAKKPEGPSPGITLTPYERSKLRHLKKVGWERRKRRTRKSHLNEVEMDDDLDINKRIEELVKRITLENEEKSMVSPVTELVPVADARTDVSEDPSKGIAFPSFDNVKQIFRFSKEYFNSKRDSRDKRDVAKTERHWNPVSHTMTERDSENVKRSKRLRRNAPRHFIPRKLSQNRNLLREWASTLDTPNRATFRGVKRKRRRRKRGHSHYRPRLDSSVKRGNWPIFNQMYSNYIADHNDYDSKSNEGSETNSTDSQKPENNTNLVVTTGSPPIHNSSSSRSINYTNNVSIADGEPLAHRQGNSSNRRSIILDDYNNRNVFHHSLENPVRQDDTRPGYKTLGLPNNRRRLSSGRYLKIRHALRYFIHNNNNWEVKKRILFDRKKRCEGKCSSMPHKCWRSAPLLCIPYIRKGQDELLKYVIKTLQNMLGKPMPQKVDIFEKIKFRPCSKSSEPSLDDIVPGCEQKCETPRTTCAPTTTTCPTTPPCQTPSQLAPSSTTSLPLTPCPLTPCQTQSTNEPACSTTPCAKTSCSPDDTITTQVSFSCVIETNTSPSSTTTCPTPATCPNPVTCPQPCMPATTFSPPTPNTCRSASDNTCALLIIGPSTTILPATGCLLDNSMTTSPGKDYSCYGYSTEAPQLAVTESSVPKEQQSQTQIPMNFYQMTLYDDKNSVAMPSGNSANTASSNYPLTSSMQDYSFSMSTNKVTARGLSQGYTTESSQVAVASTQGIRPPVTQNTPLWYYSERPIEKSQIFSYTTLGYKPPSDPNLYYQYYQSFTPSPSNQQPQLSNRRQMEKHHVPQNRYVYKTGQTPNQRVPSTMNSRTTNPMDYDLMYNDKAKSCRHFCESDAMRGYFPGRNPKEENGLRERNYAGPRGKFTPREEENLFPGDPFAYRYMDAAEKYFSKSMRPRWSRKKYPKFARRSNRKLLPNYDFDVDEPMSWDQQMYDEKYDRYNSPEMSERPFNERKRKTPNKNQRREKREIFDRKRYSRPKTSDNYDNYPDDSNYEYPENLLLPKLDLEKNHWARKREEDQNSSTPGTYALFSELAEIATLSPNETEKVSVRSTNISSTESVNKTVTSLPEKGSIDKFDTEQRSGYDNSVNPTVSILSAGRTTTTTQKQISATESGDTTPANLISTTLESTGSTQSLKSNEEQKAQIVDSGKPDKEVGSNHDIEAGEEQVMTTLKTASIAKGPKKLFTKPAPKVYTKVYPDSLPNELETNETPATSTTPRTGAEKTTVVQTLAAPNVRLQLLAVCEGYLEIVKLIKAQNQSLEEELDSDLSQYCENIISQSFDLPGENVVIKSKKPERSSPSSTTTTTTTTATSATTTQTASTSAGKIISKRRSCDGYRIKSDGLSHQDLRAKVVVDILRSPIYKKDLEAYADQSNFYPKGRKTKRMSGQVLKDDRGVSWRKYRYKEKAKRDYPNSKIGLRNLRKKHRSKEGIKEKFSRNRISEEEIELLHLLQQRKRALLSWLSNPNENRMKPNDLEETEYLDDDEYYTVTTETTEDSGTITPKGDQETSEPTTKTTFYANDTIFPVYAKQYGYDKGGELREVEVLWRRVNEETHEKKIFKNMSVLALLLTSTVAPYVKRKESKLVGGNVYETDEMSEIQTNSDTKAGFVDPLASLNEKPATTEPPPPTPSLPVTKHSVSFQPQSKPCCTRVACTTDRTTKSSTTKCSESTTPTTTTERPTSSTPTSTAPQVQKTENETVRPNNSTKKNQTYIFMRKPDPSTIVGKTPNATKGHKNSTQKISRKFELAKDFFQEYSIEFLNYAVYILPIMFTILFIMCCLCCFLHILNSRGGGRRKKNKKIIISTEEDCETTGDSENETKIRKKKKRKKSLKNTGKGENFENRRLRAFWNVLKMNSRGKQRGDMCEETSTPTEKRRSFLQFLKGKKEAVKPEELASLSYPPPCEQDEGSDEEAGMRIEAVDVMNDPFDSGMKGPVREKKEVDERREIISLLEELKKIELENLEETKNKKSVCIQYMAQDKGETVSKKTDVPRSNQVDRYLESNPSCDKRIPNPSGPHEDAGEFAELVPYEGEYIYGKNDSVRQSHYGINRGGRCERFFNMFRGSGEKINFIKSGIANKSYIYTKYKNISTDTRDELMGGTHRNADTEMDLSDDMLDNFPPYSLQRNRQTDYVDEMENFKRQLNKKKTVRLKDNGVLCRL